MKAVILAGGLGTRISEETHLKPKPMIEIGGRPILWHILKMYSAHGINEFIICCGYKGYVIKEYLRNEEAFCFTYGDGVADVNIAAQVAFHREHGKAATITAVQPPGRYGALQLDGTKVTGFTEKPRGDGGLINGGFFVLAPGCIDYIDGDESSWEGKPLAALAAAGQMQAFEHRGFWQPMDTLREKNLLEELWSSGKAPWKIW